MSLNRLQGGSPGRSQNRIVPSAPALIKIWPFGINLTAVTARSCPSSVAIILPVSVFQRRIRLSAPPLAKICPSGLIGRCKRSLHDYRGYSNRRAILSWRSSLLLCDGFGLCDFYLPWRIWLWLGLAATLQMDDWYNRWRSVGERRDSKLLPYPLHRHWLDT